MAATPFWGEAPVGMCYQYLSKYPLIFVVCRAEGWCVLAAAWAPSLPAEPCEGCCLPLPSLPWHIHVPTLSLPPFLPSQGGWHGCACAWQASELVKDTVNRLHAAVAAQSSANPHQAASVNPAEFLGFAWCVSSGTPLYSNALFMHSLASM